MSSLIVYSKDLFPWASSSFAGHDWNALQVSQGRLKSVFLDLSFCLRCQGRFWVTLCCVTFTWNPKMHTPLPSLHRWFSPLSEVSEILIDPDYVMFVLFSLKSRQSWTKRQSHFQSLCKYATETWSCLAWSDAFLKYQHPDWFVSSTSEILLPSFNLIMSYVWRVSQFTESVQPRSKSK